MDKETIYKEFSDKIKNYIQFKVNSPDDADDICSEVFIKVFENLDKYDSTKASLSTWIYTIARNSVIDFYRTRHKFVEVEEDIGDLEDIAGSTGSPEEEYLNNENLRILADALEKLKEIERSIIIYKYYYDMKQQDIADKLGISLSYVKILQKKALEKLKDLI